MKTREQAKWWIAGLIALLLILYFLSDVLLPFLLGAGIAYFTDPIADKLEKRGFSRVVSTVIITVFAFLVMTIAMMILIPLLLNQIRLAVDAAPGIIGGVRELLQLHVLPLIDNNGSMGKALNTALVNMQSHIKDISVRVLQGAWSVGLAGFQIISIAVVTPVVAFYLLMDWDRMIAENR